MSEPTVHWYDEPDPSIYDHEMKRAAALLQETSAIEQRQGNWYELNRWNAILLTNRDLPGFAWGCNYQSDMGPVDLRSENLIENIGEAHVSKASSSPMKPTPVPTGRSYKVERAVRKLDQFQFAVWRQAKSEEAAVQAYLDAYCSGIGCVRVAFDPKGKALKNEAVFFDNLVIDDRECANRTLPRTYRIRQVVPISGIESAYGCKLEKRKQRYHMNRDIGDGYEVVVEAWRLPGPDGTGGAHMVACDGKVLFYEKWTHNWVPLAFFHWQDPISGFHPKSGVEQLVPYQIRQNELNDTIQAQHDIAARVRWLAHANSSIDLSQWDNVEGRILMYAGIKPEPFPVDLSHLQHLYQERERNRASAFSFMGISEAFAQADLPQGVRADSSAGMREMFNAEDRRHLRRWKRFEQLRLEIARLNLLVLSTEQGAEAYSVLYFAPGGKASAKKIPYEAVKTLTEDQYSWSFEATPLSMMQPAARRELLRDWSSRGMGDQGEEHRMMGGLNLERLEELEMASYDDILRHLDVLEGDEDRPPAYEPPTEITNLTYGIKKVQANLLRLLNYDDVPPEIIENHYLWIQAAVAIQQAAVAQQMQAEQAMTPMMPTQGVAGTNASQAPRTLIQNMG
jgi:hypothetical protein